MKRIILLILLLFFSGSSFTQTKINTTNKKIISEEEIYESPEARIDEIVGYSSGTIFNWIMETHPIRAAGLGGQNVVFKGFDTENMDHYGLILEYPGNRRVIYSHCWYTVYGVDTNMNIVYGTEAVFDMNAGKIYKHVPRGVPQPEPEIIERPKERIDTTYLSIKDFFDCYKTGRKPFCDAEIGRTAVLTALLGRKAIYEKKVVTWEDLLKEGAPVKRWEG